MKLLPFNLERALAGDKVVTRDGREVTQLKLFKCEGECVVGVANNGICSWYKDGMFWGIKQESANDLFMAPKTVKRWVNFYETDHPDRSNGYSFETEPTAKRAAMSNAIAIAVPVEFEEGYGCE